MAASITLSDRAFAGMPAFRALMAFPPSGPKVSTFCIPQGPFCLPSLRIRGGYGIDSKRNHPRPNVKGMQKYAKVDIFSAKSLILLGRPIRAGMQR
jgi:hypothetical protein